MSVEHVEVLVEEPAMETLLRVLLPKLLGNTTFRIYPHQCKNELLLRLPQRLRGYEKWLPDNWRILVIVDRDNDDCKDLKAELDGIAANAGLRTSSAAGRKPYSILNRLAIEELEAWYFGDWEAVKAAYSGVPPTIPSGAKYHDPDAIKGGTWEALERLLQRAGYFKHGIRKIETAHAIARHMDPARNSSHSFQSLRTGLLDMVTP